MNGTLLLAAWLVPVDAALDLPWLLGTHLLLD